MVARRYMIMFCPASGEFVTLYCRAGSDPNAACGRKSEVSEWQRSTDAKAL